MSRFTVALRRVRFGPIVNILVPLAEDLLGGGQGALKKLLVGRVIKEITKVLESSGRDIPDNVDELVDELVEQLVRVLNDTNGWEKIAGSPETDEREEAAAPVPVASTPRRGRKPGSKNKPREVPAPAPVIEEPMESDDDDTIDLSMFNLDDEDDD